MDKNTILNYSPFFLTLVASVVITCLKFLKFYKTKYRYIFKSSWFWIIISANSFLSVLVFSYFKATGLKLFPVNDAPLVNYFLIGIVSPFIVNGIVAHLKIPTKTKEGANTDVNLFVWLNEAIEPEIERFIDQKVVEIVLKIEKTEFNINKLKDIGDNFLYQKKFSSEDERGIFLARLDEWAWDENLPALIGFLLMDYCSPGWLEKQINSERITSS